jgi:hypothetical protein
VHRETPGVNPIDKVPPRAKVFRQERLGSEIWKYLLTIEPPVGDPYDAWVVIDYGTKQVDVQIVSGDTGHAREHLKFWSGPLAETLRAYHEGRYPDAREDVN